MPYVMYDPDRRTSEGSAAVPILRLVAEGIRMEFAPFKPKQISDQQWRYFSQRKGVEQGLVRFDVEDSLVEDVLKERAAAMKSDSGKSEPAVKVPDDVVEGSLYAEALTIGDWKELKVVKFGVAVTGTDRSSWMLVIV